jgi:SAM-dependent methyltransferase
MANVESTGNAYKKWQSHWSSYIETSKRESSSALITAKNFIKKGAITEGARILDLGCGHGRITELIVNQVPSLEIVGVDMTPQLLDNFIVKEGVNNCKIQLLCTDISKLPFGANEFDAVISSRVFHYLPNPILGVREAYRVVKPGGKVVISMPNKLNIIKYLTYSEAPLYSPFQVREWFRYCSFDRIDYGSMCFSPSMHGWRRLSDFFELSKHIPVIKYMGGNLIVTGGK